MPRLLTIGKMKVRFKSTTLKKLALKEPVSRLAILAFDKIDFRQGDPERDKKLRSLLQQEDPKKFKHDLQLPPGRTNDYIIKLLKTPANDGMGATND